MSDQEKERERRANVELANAYREMMAGFAWKHLQAVIVTKIREDSNRYLDSVAIEHLTVAHAAEARGKRKALDEIEAEIGYILSTK